QPSQLCERRQVFAPKLPIEPEVVVSALAPGRAQQAIDLLSRHSTQRSGISRQTLVATALHRGWQARQGRQKPPKGPIKEIPSPSDPGPVARIAAENLIATFAAQRDRDGAAGNRSHQIIR